MILSERGETVTENTLVSKNRFGQCELDFTMPRKNFTAYAKSLNKQHVKTIGTNIITDIIIEIL